MKKRNILPGQESVWNYPRPPKLEPTSAELVVIFAGEVIARTCRGFRVLETSHPPSYYFPPEDVRLDLLQQLTRRSFCEFKGYATYWSIEVDGHRAEEAAWSYTNPTSSYLPIKGYISFYASRVDECFVNGEKVEPQEGDFYGGWITSNIVGPFKGGAGTLGW
ncbi:MAG: DUF427 domain-containing protein [Blastocatellia bacterium]|nr:DUF427 domain-containing protein [Blastocatellia bacterium]